MTQIRTNDYDFNAAIIDGVVSFSIVSRKTGGVISSGAIPVDVTGSFIESLQATLAPAAPPGDSKPTERKSTRKKKVN